MKKVIIPFALVGVFTCMALLFSFFVKGEKTGYVNLQEVFQQFHGKIELEKRIQQSEWSTQLYLDSMNLHLEVLVGLQEKEKRNKRVGEEIVKVQKQIAHVQQQAYEINTKRSNDYTQQIWNQINQYVSDFGAENSFDYIFGAEGGGSVMYGKKEKDLTTQIVDYINTKYNGQ